MTNFELLQNVEFDNSYEHVLDFDNATSQEEYFDDKVVEVFDDFSVVRPNEEIKISANFNSIVSNYCRFVNTINGVSKTFYAFITKKEYVNPDVTRLFLEVDVFQTYMFEYELKQSFVTREHQDRFDTSGKMLFNREPENIEIGSEYEVKSKEKILDIENGDPNLIWVEWIASQPLAQGNFSTSDPSTYKNLCRPCKELSVDLGVYVYLIPYQINGDKGFYTIDGTGSIVSLDVDFIDSIISQSTASLSKRVLHYCPIKYTLEDHNNGYLIKFSSGYQQGETPTYPRADMLVVTSNNPNFGGIDLSSMEGFFYLNLYRIDEDNVNDTLQKTFEPLTVDVSTLSINNVKNIENEPKLKSYPFSFSQVTDNQSSPLKILNESITSEMPLKYRQSIGIQSKSKLFVDNYNGDNGKFYNAINNTIAELPLLNDAFISYMASNKASATTGVALNVGMGVATLGLGILTGGIGLIAGVGASMSIGQRIAGDLIKKQDLKDTPDTIRQAGNNAEFDIIDNNFVVEFSEMEIKSQFRQKAFDYLFNYGYLANAFKVPDTKSRYYFNYVKTLGCNLKANLNNDIIEKLKSIYENGVSIWHFINAETFKGVFNYDYENLEMSIHNSQNGGE